MSARDSVSAQTNMPGVARPTAPLAASPPPQPVEGRPFNSSLGRCIGELAARLLRRGALAHKLSEGHMLLRASQQGGSEPSRVAAWIRSALGHPAWEVRNMAVKLIPRSGDPALFPLLIGRAGDRHEAGIVRRNAIAMLREANFWTPAARAVIMACFTDRYWEVRSEALATFAFLEAPSRDAEAAVLGVLRQVNRSAPHWQGSHESMIRERNFEVRAACAQALGALTTTPLGVSALTLLTHDRSWIVAYQAAVALAEVALRQANLRGQAHEGLSCVHISAEGAVPHHPYRERLQALRRLQAAGQNSPEIARSFYLDLKRGWNILSQ